MPATKDGPRSSLLRPLPLKGNASLTELAGAGVSSEMSTALEHAPSGDCIGWGIPFTVRDVVVLIDQAVTVQLDPTVAPWLVFMHTSDLRPIEPDRSGFFSPMRGEGQLGEHAAGYVLLHADGSEAEVGVRRRHQIGSLQRRWGENCFEAVAHHKPQPVRAAHKQLAAGWGLTQTRTSAADSGPCVNWLWAWENPHPDKTIVGARFEPVSGIVLVIAILEPTTGMPRRQTMRSVTGGLAEGHTIGRR